MSADEAARSQALAERASPGLHRAALAALRRHVPGGVRVADLGAGTGAWTRRLMDDGCAVTPVDLDRTGWGLADVPLVVADLNGPFAAAIGGQYDAVTALEVIEHLENPRAFLRECADLVRVGGVILVTTPNIENVAGRIRFMLTGQLRGFDRDPACNEVTHITPIQSYLFEKMCNSVGLSLMEHTFNAPTEFTQGALKRAVLGGLRPLLRGVRGGDNHVFILKKTG